MVICGFIAGAIAGSLTSNGGGIANLLASEKSDAVATPSNSIRAQNVATDEAPLVKSATNAEDMPGCLRSRNADTEAIQKPGLRALDHKTVSALTICSVILSRSHMCNSASREIIVGTFERYYDERALAKLYASRRAAMTADALAHTSPHEQERIAKADGEAQSWGGSSDQEIDATLTGLVKDGYFSLDDFKAGRAKEEIGQVLGGVASAKKACS
jgi:hypothetical protein